MRTPEFIQRCLDAGMPIDMALTAAKAFEAECEIAIEQVLDLRRAKERARQAKHRASRNADNVMSRDFTLGDVTSVGERDLAGVCAQVEDTSSSSLRSEEKKTPVSPNGDTPPLSPVLAKPSGFARFWEAYPNKVGKRAAEKAYDRAVRAITGPDPPRAILDGVERAKRSRAWIEGFIPHPTTWLNRGSWEDQPAESQPRTPHERPDADAKFAARMANYADAVEGARRVVEEARKRRGDGLPADPFGEDFLPG